MVLNTYRCFLHSISWKLLSFFLAPTTTTKLPVLNHLFESQDLHTLTFGLSSENNHY